MNNEPSPRPQPQSTIGAMRFSNEAEREDYFAECRISQDAENAFWEKRLVQQKAKKQECPWLVPTGDQVVEPATKRLVEN